MLERTRPDREPPASRRAGEAPSTEAVGEAARMLALQRGIGNRATTALVLARDPTATAPARPLCWGARGEAVYQLQVDLNELDEVATPLFVDGIFGANTERAVREFQAAHPPLKKTGTVGPDTQAAIAEARAEKQDAEKIAKKLFLLGASCYDRGAFGHAFDFFTRASALTSRPGLDFSRAQALRRLGGRRKEAIALYEKYLASGHKEREADAKWAIGELSVTATGDKTADEATAKGIFQKGAALYDAGQYGRAFDEFERSFELAPDRAGLAFSMAQALRRLGGRRKEAIALYEQYLASGHGERDADAKWAIGELRGTPSGDAAKDLDAAKAAFKEGSALYDARKFGQAADKFSKSAGLAPDRAGLLFSKAQALRKQGGHAEEAIELYEAYLSSGHGERDKDARFYLDLLRSQGAAP